MSNQQTKRSMAVLLIAAVVVASGLALTAWAAKGGGGKPDKPGGGGEPARYTQVYLGCTAVDINDAGQVVGEAFTIAGDLHAFLLIPEDCDEDGNLDWFWNDDGDEINNLMLDLGVLGVQERITADGTVVNTIEASWGRSLNDLGQVVGGSTYDVQTTVPYLLTHAFVWDGVNMIDLGTLGGDSSEAKSINNLGEVVGYSNGRAFLVTPEYDSDGNPVVWFRDDDSNGINDLMIDLGTLGGLKSEADFINDSGQVVGSADTSATDKDGRFIKHAFLITPEDTDGDGDPDTWFRDADGDGANDLMIDLGTLGGSSSWGRAMNDSGQIVGSGMINSKTNHAFLLTPEDTDEDAQPDLWFRDDGSGGNALMTDLGTLKGLTDSYSTDLNNDAQVVGGSYKGVGGPNAIRKPCLWENGQIKDLNELTDSDIDIGSGIRGINNAGQIVTYYSGYILLPIPADQ